MQAPALLRRRRCLLLVGVRGHEGGVDIGCDQAAVRADAAGPASAQGRCRAAARAEDVRLPDRVGTTGFHECYNRKPIAAGDVERPQVLAYRIRAQLPPDTGPMPVISRPSTSSLGSCAPTEADRSKKGACSLSNR